MKIALDVSPIEKSSQHSVRGVGFYITRLKESLISYHQDNGYTFFSGLKEIPSNVDVIHFPYFDPFFLTLPSSHLSQTVVTVHDVTPLVLPKLFPIGIRGILTWQIQKHRLRHTAAIITDSMSSKNDIMRITGIASSKVHVVYLAAGDVFTRKKLTMREKELLLMKYNVPEKFGLYVGDATRNKNLPRLITAVKNANVPFVLVGKALAEETNSKNPWDADPVRTQKMIKQDGKIHALGFVPTEDLVSLYNLATVFVMPSLYEGFGLSILEAMSCGCPVITTKEGSLFEVAGDAAYYVDAQSTASITDGIKKVFYDKALQGSLREKGLKQGEKFSWRKATDETTAVYKQVVNNE